ncbi:MAG: porin [Siculibacillus sp.]
MNFKLALAAAAVVGLAGTAQAADLAKKAPAAANYVKVCDAYGAGFFYIPGSDTCLKIGGFVRAEYRIHSGNKDGVGAANLWGNRLANGIGTRVRSDVNFDARTNTEMGLLRSYIDFWMTVDSAQNGTISPSLRKAFVQFAGLTAGRATSFFDFYTGGTNSVFHMATPDANVNLLAYTFSFGNGITASLSLEDSTTSDESPAVAPGVRRAYGSYAGVKTTDLVANVNVAQAWGSAQLMGVLHDDYGTSGGKLGYAVGAGVKVNLPMLAAGDQLALQAVYGKGALGYVFGSSRPTGAPAWVDFFDDGAGNISQSSAWSIAAGLTHNWSKTLGSTLAGSYASYDDYTAGSAFDFKQIDLQANLVWKPVAGLGISGNVEYRYIDNTAASGLKDGGAYVGFLRIQRDF